LSIYANIGAPAVTELTDGHDRGIQSFQLGSLCDFCPEMPARPASGIDASCRSDGTQVLGEP
jgi:hypothetical protein